MNISAWAIRNPVVPFALFLVLTTIGILSFMKLPVTRFPDVEFPVVNVQVTHIGASPSELVSAVAMPLEDALSSINGVSSLQTTVSDSRASTTIQFELETAPDKALNDVRDAVSRAQGALPPDIQPPIVSKVDYAAQPVLTYAVSARAMAIEDLSAFVDTVIIQGLQSKGSIARVSRNGGADKAILVSLRPAAMAALGITAAEVNSQLLSKNIDRSAGRGFSEEQAFSIRTLGTAQSLEDLRALPIAVPGGTTVRLDSLGRVSEGHQDARSFAMLDGQSVVGFSLYKAVGYSDVAAVEDAADVLQDMQARAPDITFTQIEDSSIFTLSSYDSAIETLIEGAILAVVVVLLFLGNWRATIVTAIALPLSIIPTFFVMNWLGFSLNTVSLLGITLVTGILVDDAIVEIENIERHIKNGATPLQAAQEASQEIGLAVIAISLTIVAVFAPVSFMSGLAGRYFQQFGLTVAVAVVFSLLVARLLTPVLSAYFLKAPKTLKEPKDGLLMRGYLRVLAWTLRNRLLTLTLGVAIFAGSIYSATLLQSTLVPASDDGRASLSLELPPGATLEQTFAKARAVSDTLMAMDEVDRVFVAAGASGVNTATVSIYYVDKTERLLSVSKLNASLPKRLADIADVRTTVLGANGTQALTLSVLGDDPSAVAQAAQALAEDMAQVATITNINTSVALPQPEVHMVIRPEMAAALGVSTQDVATTIGIATLGGPPAARPKFSQDGRQIPVIVQLDETLRHNPDMLGSMPLRTQAGHTVPLFAVVHIERTSGPSVITRSDRQAQVTVSADLVGDAVLGTATHEVMQLPLAQSMPDGTRLTTSGDADAMQGVFTSFVTAMGIGLLLVYVLLVLLFHSFITPVTILLSLPLSIGGAIAALYVTNNAISLPVLIGFLMLMGIVTKNAIMLVEFALIGMRQGAGKVDALLDAAHKRARPIIMTTIAMIAGMVPSALAFGLGGEFRAPMAIAVMGGLAASTVLSLLLVPSIFSVIEGFGARLGTLFRRIFGLRTAPRSA